MKEQEKKIKKIRRKDFTWKVIKVKDKVEEEEKKYFEPIEYFQ